MPGRSISTTSFCAFRFSSDTALNVSVHRDFPRCMTQKFLNNFRIYSVGIQDRSARVTEGVPADALRQADTLSRRFDVNAVDQIRPVPLRSVCDWARLHPIVRSVVGGLHLPDPKRRAETCQRA